MTTWIEDVAVVLSQNGFGTINGDIMQGVMPDQQTHPNAVMAVVPAPGRQSLVTAENTPQVYVSYPGVGLRFRDGPDIFLPPWNRAVAIFDFLNARFGIVVGNNYYDAFRPKMPPFVIGGKDDTHRWTIGFDVEVIRRK